MGMLALFESKQGSLLGVDIGSSSVRVLELDKKNDKYIVSAYAREVIPDDVIDGKTINKPEALSAVISAALAKAKTKTKRVAVAVPDATVISKIIQLEEGLTDDESEELVLLEADKYIPYPIDEVSIDYQYLGDSSRGGAQQDVLVVASRSENVNSRVELLKECDLEVSVVDVESYAIERTCQLLKPLLYQQGEQANIAIVDIGEMVTHLTVLHDMRTTFSRDEVFGGHLLTQEIVEHYQMSPQDARQAKLSGALPDDYQDKVLNPFIDMVCLQVRRALQLFYSTTQHSEINQLLLAGQSSLLPGLVEKVQEAIEVQTEIVNPITEMTIGRYVDEAKIKADSSGLMIACGLAMRKFD